MSLGGQPKVFLTKALADAKLAASGTEARRLITQGGVKLNGEKVADPKAEIGAGDYVVQVGKLKGARLKVQ